MSFDPAGFYQFNVAGGAVHTKGGQRVVLLSDEVLGLLVSAAVERGDVRAVRRLGQHMGDVVAQSLGGGLANASMEDAAAHISAVMGVFGWGSLGLERWGHALVCKVEDMPALDADNLGMAALLGGLFSRVLGKAVVCLPVDGEGRLIMINPAVAEQVWAWYAQGDSLSEIVGKLEPSGTSV